MPISVGIGSWGLTGLLAHLEQVNGSPDVDTAPSLISEKESPETPHAAESENPQSGHEYTYCSKTDMDGMPLDRCLLKLLNN